MHFVDSLLGFTRYNVYHVQGFIYLKRFDTSRNVFVAELMY